MLMSTATENRLKEYAFTMDEERKDAVYNQSKAMIRRQFSFGSFFRILTGYFHS